MYIGFGTIALVLLILALPGILRYLPELLMIAVGIIGIVVIFALAAQS